MADPSTFTPATDYSAYEASSPTDPKPGADLDVDFAAIEASIADLVDAVKDVRRSDGKLKNSLVTLDSLAEDVAIMLGTNRTAASDPTTRLDGSALQAGDQYFNTTDNRMRIYTTAGAFVDSWETAGADSVDFSPPPPWSGATVQSALNNLFSVAGITAKDIGLVGDGSDETALLNTLFSAGKYNRVILEEGKNYGYDPTVGLAIAGPIEIVSNGATFTEIAANTAEAVAFTGSAIKADELIFNFVGAAGSEVDERGISIDADNVDIGTIRLLATTAGTGANNIAKNAVSIGPDSGARKSNIRIGFIEAQNWDRPVVLQRLSNAQIGRIEVDTYMRAVYITNCIDMTILSGLTHTLSPNSTGEAGDNGILIGVEDADFNTRNIHIYNFAVEDSGEHGFRLAGQYSMFGVWYVGCSATRTGSGVGTGIEPDDHGGSGFKCLGPTSNSKYHQSIHYINCVVEDAQIDARNGINFVGFYLGKILGGSAVNCSVRAKNETYSAWHGFGMVGLQQFTLSECVVSNTEDASYKFLGPTSAGDWGLTANVVLDGCISNNPGADHVDAQAEDDTMRRITIIDMLINGGANAVVASKNTGGFTGCSASFVCWGLATAVFSGDTDEWFMSGRGQAPATLGPAKNGSTFAEWTGTLRLRQAGAWVDLDDAAAIRYTGTPGVTTVEGQLDYLTQDIVTVDLTSSAYNASWGETLVLTAGANDVNLPAAGGSSRRLRIVNKTGGNITLAPDGTDSTEVTSVATGTSVLLADLTAGGNEIVEI